MLTLAQTSAGAPAFDPKSFDILLALPPYVATYGMDRRARHAAEALSNVFKTEIRRHREEQENGLFVSLRRSFAGKTAEAEAILNPLLADHAALVDAWSRLEQRLAAIEFCRSAALAPNEVADFVTRFRRHQADEDEVLRRWLAGSLVGPRPASEKPADKAVETAANALALPGALGGRVERDPGTISVALR